MGNDYFQFKQFKIQQGKTAMKVCTDACLFGAYLSQHISEKRVLDIGAGTGLLALMYAQKSPSATIMTIEIEENAYLQARENIESSEWKNRIDIQHVALQQYQPPDDFDLILSNPPFFDNDLKSSDKERNMAMHSTQLSLEEIFQFSIQYLTQKGKLALLLPFHRMQQAQKIAAANAFFLSGKVLVKQTSKHDFFRCILIFTKEKVDLKEDTITIKNTENQYEKAFSDLLKDFYLFL